MKKLLILVSVLSSSLTFGQSLEDAIKQLDAERFSAANKSFAALAQSAPTPQNLFYKGYALLRSPEATQADVIKEATMAFTAGMAADKKGDPLNQVGLGMAKLASKDLAGAKVIFEEVKKATKSKNTDVLYRIAEAYTMFKGTQDAAEAIMNINMALEKSKAKDNPEYYIVKSDAYMLKNEGGDAMSALQNSERLGKKLGRTFEKMARVWLQSRNYKEADAAIKKGIAADPSHAPIYKYESSYLQTMGKFAESSVSAKKYLDNSDGDCKAKLRYAKLAFVAKDYASVKKTIAEVADCKDPYVNRMSGIVNFEEGKPNEAIADINKFIKDAPADENLGLDYGYIGRSYLSMAGEGPAKRASDSLGILNIEKAIQMGDTTFNYYQDASQTFFKNKNYVLCALYTEKNIQGKKNPNAADFASVGVNHNYAKNWVKADEYIDKALALYKDGWKEGYPLSARVKAFRNSADSTYSANYKSAYLYEKYLSLVPADAMGAPANKRNATEALVYLAGREYLLNKNNAKAAEYLQQIVKFDPSNETVKKQLDAVNGVKPAPAPPTTVPGTGTPPPPAPVKPSGKTK